MTPIEIKLKIAGAEAVEAGMRSTKESLDRAGASANQAAAAFRGAGESLDKAGASAKQAPALRGVGESLDKVGISAKQTAAALRGVPAQVTDIVTSLQGGQAPLTVFLQQGGQLKDMFGGAGAAAKALGGYVLGMINPVTVAAAAVGVFYLASESAGKTVRTLNSALLEANGRIPQTANELRGMADALALNGSSRGSAAEVVKLLSSNLVVANLDLQRFSQSALDLERYAGRSFDDTAKTLQKLTDEPAKTAAAMHLLTASQYELAKSLESAGDKSGAAKIALGAYGDEADRVIKGYKANLGTLDFALAFYADAGTKMWNALTGATMGNTGEQRIAKIKAELFALHSGAPLKNAGFVDSLVGAFDPDGVKRRLIAEKEAELGYMLLVTQAVNGNAKAEAERQRVQRAGISAIDAVTVAQDKGLTKQQQMNKALDAYSLKIKDLRATNPDSKLLNPLAIARGESAIRDQFKDSGGASAAKAYNRELEQQKSLISELSGLSSTFYKDWDSLNKQYAQGRISLEALGVAQGALLAKQPAMVAMAKDEAEQQKARIKIYDDDVKAQQKLLEQRENAADQIEDALRKAKEEEQAHILAAVAGITHAEALAEIALARASDNYQKELAKGADGEILLELQRELEARRKLVTVMGQKGVREANKKASDEVTKDWEKTAQTIGNTLSDYIMGGGRDAATYLKRLFSTLVLQPVVQTVVGGAGGLAATAASAAGFDGVAKGLNAASSANSMHGMATGYSSGVNTAASLFGAGSAAGASAASLGYANAIGAIGGDSLGALIAANGSWGGVAAGTAAGTAATGTAAAGGAAAGGAGLTSALSAIPVWGWIAAAVVAVASAFGGRGKKEITGSGITGVLSGGGSANVSQYADWEQDGGWFHSDRGGRNLSGINSELQTLLDNATTGITASTRSYAAALGLNADAVYGYTHAIDVSLKDLSPEQQQEAIGAALSGFSDGMAAVYEGLSGLVREGEGASATLARLSGALTTTNTWLSMLRQRVFQLGLAGGDAASKLADAMGGLENLGAAVQQYYDLYYTETEKVAYSTEQMTIALAAAGLAMPATKDAFRAMADSLDLNTEAGRTAYATLLTIAPTFASTADQIAKLAQEAAAKLLETFSGRQQLIPLLDATLGRFDALGAGLDVAASSVLNMGNATGWINTQLGNTSSGLLFFGDLVQGLGGDMTGAQLASAELSGQILNLKLNAGRTVTDIAGLSAALANVNTETFLATMQGVLARLGSMFSDVLNSISDERVAVREAALQIINPTVMSKGQILSGIAGSNVGMPSNARLVAAQNAMGPAYTALDSAKQGQAYWGGAANTAAANVSAAQTSLNSLNQWFSGVQSSFNQFAAYRDWAWSGAGTYSESMALVPENQRRTGQYNQDLASYNAQNGALSNSLSTNQSAYSTAQQWLQTYNAAAAVQQGKVAAAEAESKTAQLAYIDSLQNYAIDAGKAAARLGQLREETVKYYESQKALADLMSQSAGTLRQTVADYRYGQLSPEEQFRSLEGQFNTAYAMALSTSGETLAGYADQMSGLLGPMLDKMSEAGYGGNASAIASYLARAEAVAGRVESQTPTNYAADSLDMLGQIDGTLAALEAGSKSAERIIADAINVGRDQTVNGLRQVTNALTGRAVSYFADGGAFTNGVVTRPTAFNTGVMGEAGPEGILPLANVGGRLGVFSAGGDSTAMLQELRAVRRAHERVLQDNANMRIELRAIATSTAKTARSLDRMDADGLLVRTDADTPLATVPA